jgi:hypothetical protein
MISPFLFDIALQMIDARGRDGSALGLRQNEGPFEAKLQTGRYVVKTAA